LYQLFWQVHQLPAQLVQTVEFNIAPVGDVLGKHSSSIAHAVY
jgi:hypothetical protein